MKPYIVICTSPSGSKFAIHIKDAADELNALEKAIKYYRKNTGHVIVIAEAIQLHYTTD